MSRIVRMMVCFAILGGLAALAAPSVHSMAAEARDGGKGGGAEPDIAFMDPGNQVDPSTGTGSGHSGGSNGHRMSDDGSRESSLRRLFESAGRRLAEAMLQLRRVVEAGRSQGASR